MADRDPVDRAAEADRDLYDVATWEPRGALDRLSVSLYGGLLSSGRLVVVLAAALIVVSQFALSAAAVAEEPPIALYVALSVVPALALAGYVYQADVTSGEPLGLLVATFLLGFVLAGFAAVLNSAFSRTFAEFGIPLVVFFFVIVGPVEETVKLLAIRLFAYRSDAFDAVIDGAVYGAVAGLGFATIENTIYITDQYLAAAGTTPSPIDQTRLTAAVRTFAGPGHVIYSAFAGYYLGLAKFNPEDRGPIVVKGLLVAAVIHATYNSLVSNLFDIATWLGVAGVSDAALFVAFVIVYDGVFGYVLYRKLAAYRRAYFDAGADRVDEPVETVERDEFVWDRSEDL